MFLETKLEKGLAVVVVLCFVLAVWAFVRAASAEAEWRAWASQHCRVTGVIAAQTSTGLGVASDGKAGMVTFTTPERRTYACDDGITYTR